MNTREKTASSLDPKGTERGSGPGQGRSSTATDGRRSDTDAQEYESITARTARIEHKMIVAQLLLERLSPLDPRARLLGSAVLRRDEVLLDGILSQMTDAIAALAERPAPAKKT
jgi:hypothetical protein